MKNLSLKKIDTSFWKINDPDWVRERSAQWLVLEKKLSEGRRKSELNAIKQYFLMGKMPNWKKYKNWDGDRRHVDLLVFLWLHPSEDFDFLVDMFRIYVDSDLIHYKDIVCAYEMFLKFELNPIRWENNSVSRYQYPFLGNKNIILFRVMVYGIYYSELAIENLLNDERVRNEKILYLERIRKGDFGHSYSHFLFFRNWLLMPDDSPLSKSSLFRYDEVLDWIFINIRSHDDSFLKAIEYKKNITLYHRALYCIFNYRKFRPESVEKVYAAAKLRQLISERELVADFKLMWEDIKNDRVPLKNPWKWKS